MGSYQTTEPPKDFGKAAVEYYRVKQKNRERIKKVILSAGVLSIIIIAILAFSGNFDKLFIASSSSNNNALNGAASNPAHEGVTILEEWDMPGELKEISGLSYVDKDRMACVQDEIGNIYIYNISTKEIEKTIAFGSTGDYEGLAVVGNTVWVLRADGVLIEVKDINAAKPAVTEHRTHLTIAQDCEGLCYDPDNNRLLVTVKEKDPNSDTYKGIYAFDLANRTMDKTPAFKIDLGHKIFEDVAASGKKKKASTIMPAAIAIHPVSKDMFITDGPRSRLLITDKEGSIKKFLQLDNKKFMQPEGITFNKEGELFISNEGKDVPGNILKVGLDAK
jgi:uncharacterized protein YjiK